LKQRNEDKIEKISPSMKAHIDKIHSIVSQQPDKVEIWRTLTLRNFGIHYTRDEFDQLLARWKDE